MINHRTLVVGNWKMNLNASQASLLVHRLQERIRIHRDVEVVLAPSLLTLQPMSNQIDRRKFRLASQNAYYYDHGAYTGEVSFTMLQDLVHYAIVGHSERRIHFAESLSMVREKTVAAVRNNISPIICVGETASEKHAKETKKVLHSQVTTALGNLTSREIKNVVIAYEPVWAIGENSSGPAKPDEVAKALDYIRKQVADLFGERASKKVRLLYGGSVDDSTAGGFLGLEQCDGVLVGGASLNYHQFSGIVEVAYKLRQEEKG